MPELRKSARTLREQTAQAPMTSQETEATRSAIFHALEPQPHRSRRSLWRPALVLLAAVLLLWAVLRPAPRPSEPKPLLAPAPQPSTPPSNQGWYTMKEPPPCAQRAPDRLSTLACERPMPVQLESGAVQLLGTLERNARGLHLSMGELRIERLSSPLRLRVSHGELQASSPAKFRAVQTERGGRIKMLSGRALFVPDQGEPVAVQAQESLRWPQSKPQTKPSVPKPILKPKKPAPSVKALLKRLLRLKGQGRHEEVVRLLERAVQRKDLSKVQKKRLSVELGRSLRRAGRPQDELCAYWRSHKRRFGAQTLPEDALQRCSEDR